VEAITIYKKQIVHMRQTCDSRQFKRCVYPPFCVIKTRFNYQILLNLSIWLSRKDIHRYMFALYV